MKIDIILAGVGGQGILSIGAILGDAALYENLFIKQAETHGMSQRGGAVVSHVRIADHPVSADLIYRGQADFLLAMEPMEALRQLPFLGEKGMLISNMEPCLNLPNYPPVEKLWFEIEQLPRYVLVDGGVITHELCNPKGINMVMLGALSVFIPLKKESLHQGIKDVFETKGEKIISLNIQAFETGRSVVLDR
ncbi:indolepyruvate oxidoreductase subunit beta [Mangrovibacterium sp.]|uniref:indolepyruvate oxidoreductase subunit beta n=1 Tax=Mangrovibacterium sp. TaxID=1961364 RepID=UPI003564281A